MSGYHATVRVTGRDRRWANIDRGIAPLIKALWDAGYQTIGSCEDLGSSIHVSGRKADYWDGYVLIDMPLADACDLLDFVKNTAQFQDKMHWASPGAWEVSLPVQAIGDDDAAPGPWAQVHFPREQVDDLVKVLTDAT